MNRQENTAETVLNDFYRYIRTENSKRKGGFGFNFDLDEGRRFADQIRMLERLEGLAEDACKEAAAGAEILLDREICYPEELSKEQLLYYFSRRGDFAANAIRPGEEYYGRLYLLELANELHHDQARLALAQIFCFWDAMKEAGFADPEEAEEYLRRLCLSFLIPHSELAKEIREGLVERDLYWKYDLIGEIRQGRFARAGLFVRKYARLLKKEELSGSKPFVERTWQAMPDVFAALDAAFGDRTGHLFRTFLTAGAETGTPVEILPVRKRRLGIRHRIPLSDTCFLDSRPSYGSVHRDRWIRTEWVLKEGAQDFLYLIHLYTESFVREYDRAPKRKRTADRFLKKKYLRTGDDPRVIFAMKEFLKDPRFERAVGEGVSLYMKSHPVLADSRPMSKKQHETFLYQMDHQQPAVQLAIDLDRIRQAKSDADSVLEMLHKGEVIYEKREPEPDQEEKEQSKSESLPDLPNQEETEPKRTESFRDQEEKEADRIEQDQVSFTGREIQYLRYLLLGQSQQAAGYLTELGLSENLMMKEINEKALVLWEDILLERAGAGICLLEEYYEEVRAVVSAAQDEARKV